MATPSHIAVLDDEPEITLLIARYLGAQGFRVSQVHRGADLLVMGCYGHSRAREWALGGASRSVLQSMTVPVLMSH